MRIALERSALFRRASFRFEEAGWDFKISHRQIDILQIRFAHVRLLEADPLQRSRGQIRV
jgi:hypothetical protein